MRMRPSKPSAGSVIGVLALVVATSTGTAFATATITGANIKDGTVTGADIKTSSLTGSDIASNSVSGGDIANGSIGLSDLAPSARPVNPLKGVTVMVPGDTCPAGSETTDVRGSWGAINRLLADMGAYPYEVYEDSFSGYRLREDAETLSMTPCTFN